MDKKNLMDPRHADDLKGFEEFIEGVSDGPRTEKNSRSVGGENLSFVINDNIRLKKLSHLIAGQLPIARDHKQGEKIIEHQRNLNAQLKNQLFTVLGVEDSSLQMCLTDVWNSYFDTKA